MRRPLGGAPFGVDCRRAVAPLRALVLGAVLLDKVLIAVDTHRKLARVKEGTHLCPPPAHDGTAEALARLLGDLNLDLRAHGEHRHGRVGREPAAPAATAQPPAPPHVPFAALPQRLSHLQHGDRRVGARLRGETRMKAAAGDELHHLGGEPRSLPRRRAAARHLHIVRIWDGLRRGPPPPAAPLALLGTAAAGSLAARRPLARRRPPAAHARRLHRHAAVEQLDDLAELRRQPSASAGRDRLG